MKPMKQFTLFLVFTTLFSFVLSAQKPQVQMPQGTSIVNMDQPSKGKNPLGSKGTMKNVDKVDINESSTLNQGQWYTQSFSRSELDENSKYDVEVIPEYGDPDLYIWKNSSDVIRDSRQDAMMTERLSFKLKDLLGSEDQINVSVYGYSETRFRITIRQVVTSISPPNFCNSNLAFESPSDDDRPKSGDDVYVKVVAEQYKDIEWVDLYVNNEFWSKERTHPYEWGSPGSTTDAPLRNVSPGTYDLKCIYQTRCGDRHEITKTITVESSGPDFGGDVVNKEEECPFIDEFSATSGSNGGVDLTISSNFYHEINRVDYFRNGQQIGSIFQSPFSFTDNNGSNNSDVYSATFSYVQTNETCTLTATISNTSTPQSDPCELITDFDAGLLSNGDVSLSIFTDFIQEVRQVDYYKNGQQIGSLFQSPFDYFDRNVSNGNYTYKAIIKFAQSSTDCEIEKSLSVDFNSSSDNSCLGPTNPGRICPNNYDPVCGCNDVTYSNSCLAEAAGVKSWTRGECSSSSDNSCQGITDPGRICPNNYDPVCGCNDVTYSNSCLAEAAGVKTWTRGECSNGQNCSYWEYTDRDSWYEKSFKYNEKVYFKPSNNSSIEKVEFYDENSRIGSVNKRNDGRYWFTVRSHWPERFYTCKVRIKRRNCNHWHERPFKIRVVRNHNNACDWKWRNRNEFCDKHFKHGDHWKWKMEPDHHQDIIEWVEWYKGSVSNSNRMRRETQYPYEWDSRNGNDSKMRNWSEGRHKVIIWVKKRCRTEPFKL
jgi:hypothetical protein